MVSDESVAQCIRNIRKALGDTTCQVLQTVPGQGFLLVGSDAQRAPPTGQPVIQVDEIAVRTGGQLADRLAQRVRQDIMSALVRRSGIRVAGDQPPDYAIRGTVGGTGNAPTAFMEIEEVGGRGLFFAEGFEVLDEDPDAFAARLTRKITNIQRVSAIAHFGRRLLGVPDADLDLQQLLQKAAYHYSRNTWGDTAAARRVLPGPPTATPIAAWPSPCRPRWRRISIPMFRSIARSRA